MWYNAIALKAVEAGSMFIIIYVTQKSISALSLNRAIVEVKHVGWRCKYSNLKKILVQPRLFRNAVAPWSVQAKYLTN